MRSEAAISIMFTLIVIGLMVVNQATKEPEMKAEMNSENHRERVVVIDSMGMMEYSYDPDVLLRFQDSTGDESMASLVNSNVYDLFLKKERMVASYGRMCERYGLRNGARILEYASLKEYPGRAIILWMVDPRVFIGPDDMYTCPEVTLGKGYYSGKPNFSLLDEEKGIILNTVNLEADEYTIGDTTTIDQCFEIPFAIANPQYKSELAGLKYFATGGDTLNDGMAQVLFLNDYNGDGKKLEFGLFEQFGCMMCATTLIGYSPRRDSLFNYNVTMTVLSKGIDHKDTSYTVNQKWVDHLFQYRIDTASGVIEYEIDYRGRGGDYERMTARYNKDNENFEAVLNIRPQSGDDSLASPFYMLPQRTR